MLIPLELGVFTYGRMYEGLVPGISRDRGVGQCCMVLSIFLCPNYFLIQSLFRGWIYSGEAQFIPVY